MKINHLIYVVSLLIIIGSVVMAVENPETNRILSLAGGLFFLGCILNIISYILKKKV